MAVSTPFGKLYRDLRRCEVQPKAVLETHVAHHRCHVYFFSKQNVTYIALLTSAFAGFIAIL